MPRHIKIPGPFATFTGIHASDSLLVCTYVAKPPWKPPLRVRCTAQGVGVQPDSAAPATPWAAWELPPGAPRGPPLLMLAAPAACKPAGVPYQAASLHPAASSPSAVLEWNSLTASGSDASIAAATASSPSLCGTPGLSPQQSPPRAIADALIPANFWDDQFGAPASPRSPSLLAVPGASIAVPEARRFQQSPGLCLDSLFEDLLNDTTYLESAQSQYHWPQLEEF